MKAPLLSCVFFLVLLSIACNADVITESPHVAKLSLPSLQDPVILDFRGAALAVSNSGGAGSLLRWEISAQDDWLVMTPNSGQTMAGKISWVNLTLKPGLAAGTYQTSVTVSSTGDKPISFDVNAEVINCATSSTLNTLAYQYPPRNEEARYVPNQLLISYKGNLSTNDTSLHTLAQEYGFRTLRAGLGYGPDIVQFDNLDAKDLEAFAKNLASDPRIAYAEPNYYLEPLGLIPKDPLYIEQWNMSAFGLPNAWEIETGAPKIDQEDLVIAILDSGIQIEHEDLRDKILPGCDFFDGDSDPRSFDGHGTHVAGIAAAIGNNGIGVAGVAFGLGVKISPIKIFNDEGTEATLDSLANAIRWAAGLGTAGFTKNPYPANIINISLGALETSQAIDEAVKAASEAGVLIFVAAGNDGIDNNLRTPANAPDAIAVGSVDSDFGRSSFSNYNNFGGKTVDIMAPGGRLVVGSTPTCAEGSHPSINYILSTFPNNNFSCLSGTSMAAPFAAGVAALIWSNNPSLSAQEVKTRMLESTYFDQEWNPKAYGQGVICADKALGAETLCGR